MALLGSALDPAGPMARDIEDLWLFLLWGGVAVFVLVAVLLALGLRRSHRAGGGDEVVGEDDVHGRSVRPWLVGGGVVLPAVVVVGVLVATIATMRATADAADDGLVVDVTGHQWWWEYEYPAHGVETANELHIPAGERVELVLASSDVIHSFWVPALAGKLDALPDHDNVLVIAADEPGTYRGSCAEFCGLEHANMGITVVAHDAAGFQRWLDEQAQPASSAEGELASRGREVFLGQGCGSCHTIAGTSADGTRGPDLTHLASRSSIGGGVLDVTAEDLARWLAEPHAGGEEGDVPAADLTADEIDAVVSYLEQLR